MYIYFSSSNVFENGCIYIYIYIYRMENKPLEKYIRHYIRDSSGVFSISSLVKISMTSLPALTLLFVQNTLLYITKRKLRGGLKI